MSTEFNNLLKASNATIHNVSVRFWLKIQRQDNTLNGNGYGVWVLKYAWFRKRGVISLFTQKLGNGDNGERCAS